MENVRRSDPTGAGLIQLREKGWIKKQTKEETSFILQGQKIEGIWMKLRDRLWENILLKYTHSFKYLSGIGTKNLHQ